MRRRPFDFISLATCFCSLRKAPTRDVSGAQAVRALQRLGFAVVRQRGSHVRLANDALSVTVPTHSSIAPGTLQVSSVKRA